ncbi:TonB-dependent receptor [Novosphingobium nitrogenifigens DSM 19370]|uniref:TonB-dependent receptor n=1 Tax=Novosphingobium nitrogenifigens DSM 19370 TaxID=983920 RepID=F1Z3U7_9SPHN|nr:TonB-dependent receptor [Novosphingobium nitrogenifigens]EGD60729.1 TonB-dependent receptor [Novosphingobium nitrogenifigens DSM 19370]
MPALAREVSVEVSVGAMTAGPAARALARQTGVSIAFRDSAMTGRPTRGVAGHYPPAQALARMLADTGLQAREVAPGVFVVDAVSSPPPVQASAPRSRSALVPETTGEGVVVTGTKRKVPLDLYPGGIEVIVGDAVSTSDGAKGTDAIEVRLSSVSSTHLGPGRNKLFIRGIADSSFVGPTQATVGQYWGNSRITYSAPDPSLRLYDIARIEVLEGPQGTLYGAGSMGGVVRVVPNAPDLGQFGGQLWGGTTFVQHGQPGGDGGAIVNVPIVKDKLALRVLGFGSLDGGYIDDTLRKLSDINTVRTYGGRAALRYKPGNDWTIDVSALSQRIGGDDSQYADREGNGLTRATAIAQPFSNAILLSELVVGKRWNELELTTSFSYANQHVFERYAGAALTDAAHPQVAPMSGAYQTAFTQQDWIHMFTGEVRLAKSRRDGTGWLIAFNVLHNDDRIRRQMGGTDTSNVMAAVGVEGGPVALAYLSGVRNRVDEETLYGEYSLHLQKRLTLTLGGRLTRSRLAGQSEDVATDQALRIDPTAGVSRTEMRGLPSAALVWRPWDKVSLFARYQESFRPGGIAIRQDYIERFQGDRVRTVEGGMRLTGRTFDSSFTVSWSNWQNIQADLIDGFGFPTTANIGDGRVLSFSLAGHWRPLPGLQLEGSVLANESHITQPSDLATSLFDAAIDRSRLPNVADWIGRIGAKYEMPIGATDRFDVSAYARYTGKSTLGVGSVLGQLQGNYIDTGLDFKVGNTSRSLTLSITNLSDARGNRFALGSPFLLRTHDEITPLRPRSFRLGFDFAF